MGANRRVRSCRRRRGCSFRASCIGLLSDIACLVWNVLTLFPLLLLHAQCIREKMDLIDIEEDTIDAELLASMAVTQEHFKFALGEFLAHVVDLLSVFLSSGLVYYCVQCSCVVLIIWLL
jgi:hypothetical protein